MGFHHQNISPAHRTLSNPFATIPTTILLAFNLFYTHRPRVPFHFPAACAPSAWLGSSVVWCGVVCRIQHMEKRRRVNPSPHKNPHPSRSHTCNKLLYSSSSCLSPAPRGARDVFRFSQNQPFRNDIDFRLRVNTR